MRIHTAIDIAAPAETVWRILMDFEGAPQQQSCCARHTCKRGRARALRRALQRNALMRFTPAFQTAYQSWNPFIKEISGDAKVGARLRLG